MLTFICLFLPSLISLGIYEKLNKKSTSIKKSAYLYSLFNLINNFICLFVKTYILETGFTTLTNGSSDMSVNAALNYLIMSIPLSVVIAFAASLIRKNAVIDKE